jgi:large subunit ribosomal protein L29
MSSIQELKDMSETDLNNELINLRREQFNLRMQQGAGDSPKTHRFSVVKKDIARIKTVLTQKSK